MVTVREGASLALRCRGRGTPLPLVSWHRAGHTSTPLAQGRGEVGLLLESLTREDQGTLLCRADNGVGQAAEDKLLLDVQTYIAKRDAIQSTPVAKTRHTEHDGPGSPVVSTVFSFVDRPATQAVTVGNMTDKALAQLYAHVQGMPEIGRASCRERV